MGGSTRRIREFAQLVYDQFKDEYNIPIGAPTNDLAKSAGR
jgi:hypothetical protein